MKNKTYLIFLIFYIIIHFYFSFFPFKINIFSFFYFLFLLIYFTYQEKNKLTYIPDQKQYQTSLLFLNFLSFFLFLFLGFILGFVKSPYNHSILSILKNILISMIPIIAIEKLRFYFVYTNSPKKKNIFLYSILFFILEFDFLYLWKTTISKEALFHYICSKIIPLFSNELLWTSLSQKGIKTIYMRITWLIILYTLPIFPNLDWFTIGITSLFINFLYELYLEQKLAIKKKQKKEKIPSFFIIITTIYFFFMIGAFPYQSIAIISNSMNPSIERGDVLIYKKLKNYKNLSPGTIIVFKKENKNYVHRIKNRIESTTTYYETKGDANPQIDQYLVPEKNILGICIFKIKYIGYPSIWLYEFFES